MDFESIFFKKTGQKFSDKKLLKKALTHDSCGEKGRDFERMEFLGDSCLDLFIAKELLLKSNLSEGKMSKARSWVSRGSNLAKVLRSWKAEAHFNLGLSLDRKNLPDSVYADILESVIGAFFLDRGLEPLEAALSQVFSEQILDLINNPLHVENSKSQIQEHLMSLGLPLPKYKVVKKTGSDHEPLYIMQIDLGKLGQYEAQGGSLKSSEMKAAQVALEKLNLHTKH